MRKPLISTAATVSGGNLTITLPNVGVIRNGTLLRFVVAQTIDYTNPLGTVSVSINGTTFTLIDKYGNSIRISQIRTRRPYVVAVGAQTPTAIMLTCVPCPDYTYPTYPTPAPAAEATIAAEESE